MPNLVTVRPAFLLATNRHNPYCAQRRTKEEHDPLAAEFATQIKSFLKLKGEKL